MSLRYLAVFTVCALYVGLLYSIPIDGLGLLIDSDSAWHLAAGDLIRETGKIPLHDTWSFTASGYRWYNISWIWDIGVSYVHEHLGWYGQVALATVLTGLTYSIVFYHCWQRSNHFVAAFLITSLTLLSGVILVRPFLVSNLFTVGCLFLFYCIYTRRLRDKWLWILPVIMSAWVNFHGGFIILLVIAFAYLMEDLVTKNIVRVRTLFVVGVGCAFATVLNPEGIFLAEAIWRTLGGEFSHMIVNEWEPLQFKINHVNIWLYFIIVAYFCFYRCKNLKISIAETLLLAVGLVMTLMSVRNLTFVTLAAAPVLATSLAGLFPEIKKTESNPREQWFNSMCLRLNRPSIAVAGMILALLATISLFTPAVARQYPIYGQEIYTNVVDTANWVRKNYPNQHFLTDYDIGGPLVYAARGNPQVFVDGRAETAYPQEVLKDYIKFSKRASDRETIMKKYHMIGAIVHDNKAKHFLRDEPNWKLQFSKNDVSVFIYKPVLRGE